MSTLARLALIPVAFLGLTAVAAQTQTADEIIEKHIAAVGGRAALAKITSRTATGNVTLNVQGNDISGPYEAWNKAPNKTRVLLKLDTVPLGGPGEMVIDQRFDGTTGISLNSMQGDSPITGNQLDNMRNGAFPSAMLTYKERGVKVEVLPREKAGTQELIVLQLTPKTGSVTKVYFDASTFLVAKQVAKVSHPELGDFEQTVTLTDYRTVDGVKVPFHTVNSSPVQTVTVKIAKVQHNAAVDDAMFVKK